MGREDSSLCFVDGAKSKRTSCMSCFIVSCRSHLPASIFCWQLKGKGNCDMQSNSDYIIIHLGLPLFDQGPILSWSHFPVMKKAKRLWRAASLILFWALWKERSKIIFEDASRIKTTVICLSIHLAWVQCKCE